MTMTDQALQTLASLLPPSLARAAVSTFQLIDIADEEITASKRRHPKRVDEINAVFAHLFPPARFKELDPRVYRHHVRELVERAAGADDHGSATPMTLATAAEVLVTLMEQSLRAPLAQQYAALYETLFLQVMGAKVPGEPVREPWPGASAELLAALRRKCNRRPSRLVPNP